MQPRSTLHGLAFFAALLAGLELGGAPATAQTIDQHFAPLTSPPSPGAYPAEVQQALEEGFRQLALVDGPADEGPLEAAKAAFERAVDADADNALAWNGRGMYELIKDEGWLVLLESLKKLFNRDHISMAIKAFERALEADPQFHAARYNLALAFRQARGEENLRRAATELEQVVREAPATGHAPLLLVLTYRDLGNREAMERSLQSAPETESFPNSTRRLLLAYALILGGRAAEGAEAYWQGIEAIRTDHEAKLFWHDIRPIATPEEDAQFASLPIDQKKASLRDYWQRLADDAFVTPGERLAEHYRRLEYASQHFRLDIPERRHYSSLAAYAPPWQTGYDDRGVIYLRHGPPDDEATYAGPEVERNISWKYERTGRDPLVFHFVSDEDVQDFKLVRTLSDAVITNNTTMKGQTLLDSNAAANASMRGIRSVDRDDRRILAADRRILQELYASRGSLDPMYDRAALNLDAQILDAEESVLARDIAVGTGSQSYTPQPSEAPLPFAVQAVPFRGPEGRPVVEFYYAIPTNQLSILAVPGGGSRFDYDYRLHVSPETGSIFERRGQEVHVSTRRPVPQEPGVMVPAVESISLTPGAFRYGMKVTDLTSGRFGIVEGTLGVDDFASKSLSLSGILLASSIEPARDRSDPFVRGGLRVLPMPSHVFRRNQPVHVYYEVYGLDAAPGGGARYRTTYTLEAREADRNVVAQFFSAVGELLTRGRERGRITYQFERAEGSNIDPLVDYFSLDVAESPAGEYMLIVEVEDLATGDKARREAPLTLQ
jgi:GWxTD domain-containing protein